MSESSYPQRTPSGVAQGTTGASYDEDALTTGSTTTGQGSTAQQAADEAKGVASHAGGAAKDVASHAGDAAKGLAQETKEKAGEVAGEAKQRARDLTGQAREQLRGKASEQQQRLASGLRSFGDELAQMAGSSESGGYAADLADRAGDLSRRAASWFEDREPGNLLGEVESFARRRPGAFLAIAAGAGLLAGRLVRGLRDANADDTDRPASYTPSAGYADTGYGDTGYAQSGYAGDLGGSTYAGEPAYGGTTATGPVYGNGPAAGDYGTTGATTEIDPLTGEPRTADPLAQDPQAPTWPSTTEGGTDRGQHA